VLVADDHPLASQSTVDATTLAQYPLLISGQSLVHQQISNWFGVNLDQLEVSALIRFYTTRRFS